MCFLIFTTTFEIKATKINLYTQMSLFTPCGLLAINFQFNHARKCVCSIKIVKWFDIVLLIKNYLVYRYAKHLWVLLCSFLDVDTLAVSFDKLYNTDFNIESLRGRSENNLACSTSFLEWQPCHSPVMVFCLFRAIYLGSSKWFFKCTGILC